MVNFRKVRRAQLAKSTLLTSGWCPWDLFGSFKVCSDAKERVGCGKEQHLFISSKTATLVPEFAVKDLPMVRTLDDDDDNDDDDGDMKVIFW